jgi:squalene cyclase
MDVTSLINLVEQNGSDLEKARMRHILFDIEPELKDIQPFLELQNNNGGFPYDLIQGNLSSVDTTLTALWWLDELGMLESTAADKALGYLNTVQRDDGGWDEDSAISQYDLPPWISPGDLRTRLYLSAYTAYWLALGGYRTRSTFKQVLDFLLSHQAETGKFYGYLHTTWIATSVCILAGDRYAEAAERGLLFLLDKPLAEWADSQISWAIDCLSRAGLPKEHPFIEKGLTELLQRQASAGSWSSEDGEAFEVGAIIGALKVLKRFFLLPEEDE